MRKTAEEKRQALVKEIALRKRALDAMRRVADFVLRQGEGVDNPYFMGFLTTLAVQRGMQEIAIVNRKQRLEASYEAKNR